MRKLFFSVLLLCVAITAIAQSPQLRKREYYIDTDPGAGHGTVTTIGSSDSVSETILSIPTAGLGVGSHILYIRYADTAGVWGLPEGASFAITGTLPEIAAPRLSWREYFIDTDPGAGNGTTSTFALADSLADTILSIATTGLAGGQHLLYIRYADSTGKWGQLQSVSFAVTGMTPPAEAASAPLAMREYFIDTDPGTGNGTLTTFSATDTTTDTFFSVPTAGLAAGPHLLYIRYADTANKWGQTTASGFSVSGYIPPPEVASPRLYKMEYFVDTDPGTGNGVVSVISYADSSADTVLSIATAGLPAGNHSVFVRYADSTGRWGQLQSANFTINGIITPAEAQRPRLRQREYFIDTDPGRGNGIGALVAYADSLADTILSISTTGLAGGSHILYIRYADSAGVWGIAQGAAFGVPQTIAEAAAPKLARREYFIDTDPGRGHGTGSALSYADSINELISINTTGLAVGGHVAYLRYADTAGKWGEVQSIPFNVTTIVQSPPTPPLRRREYFIDTDPGLGLGTVTILPVADSMADTILAISTGGLSLGYHVLYIRYSDTSGAWGQVQPAYFSMATAGTAYAETQAPRIAKREYFIDTDPGAGNGIGMPLPFADTVADTALSISSTGIASGTHLLYMRYADSTGRWGMAQSISFIISGAVPPPEVRAPGLVKREYFVDTDPGVGNGTGVVFAACDSLSDTALSIATTGLSAGNHSIFIRYADSMGKWSGVQSAQFVISGVPPAIAEIQSARLAKREYFIDTDPGVGLGVVDSFSVADSVADTIFSIPTIGLAAGGHILYIRYADSNGVWGQLQSAIFVVNTATSVIERQSARLNRAEYYFDLDPGAGNGTLFTFAAADTLADSSLTISTSGMDSGAHILYIRYADTSGTWGQAQCVLFHVISPTVIERQSAKLLKREYYFDTDPGMGFGISSSFSAADSVSDTLMSISTTGLSIGSHVLYMRYADTTLKWGLAQGAVFNITNPVVGAEVQAPKIRLREYYIDTDPGPGNGTVTTLAYADSISETIFSIPTTGIAAGGHALYIRYADSTGKWGLAQSALFTIINPSGVAEVRSPPLMSGEYYIDTDPGSGHGIALPAFAMADTATSTLSIPTTGLATGYHRAYLRYKDSAGTWGIPTSLPINVCLPPIALSSISAVAGICQGASTTVTDTATGGIWSSSTPSVATINASGVVTGLTAGTTVLTYTKTNACGAAIVTQSIVISNSNVVLSTGTPAICSGASANIGASGSTFYTWTPAAGLNSTTAATVIASPTVTTIYTVVASDAYGCTNSATQQIVVNASPVISTGPATPYACFGSTTTLTASGGVTYSWFPAVTFNNTAGSIVTISPSAPTTYTVTGQNASGCVGTRTVSVNVLTTPVLSAMTGDTVVCQGATGVLTDTATGGSWASSAPSIATVTPAGVWTGLSAGSAIITFTKTNACFTVNVHRTVLVNVVPSAISPASAALCQGDTFVNVALTSVSGSPAHYNILYNAAAHTAGFTDVNNAVYPVGGVIHLSVPASMAAATYYALLTLNNNSCTSTPAALSITVRPAPVLLVTVAHSPLCLGSTTTLTASGAASYSWAPAGTLNTSTAAAVIATPTVSTTYTLTGISALGCPQLTAAAGTVTVGTPPQISLSPLAPVCQPSALAPLNYIVTHGAPAYYSISWSSAAIAAGFANVTAVPLTPGSVAVSLPTAGVPGYFTGSITVADSICISSAYTISPVIYTDPTLLVTSVNAPCAGYAGSINLSGTDSATVDYRVDGGSIDHLTFSGTTYSLNTGIITTPHTYLLLNAHNPACGNTYNDTITITPVAMQWIGGAGGHETDWHTGSNWTCGFEPLVTDDITVGPAVFEPSIITGSTGNAKGMNILPGSAIAVTASATLNVAGDLRNAGIINGHGHVVLNGSTVQHLSGRGTISNLELNNSGGAVIDTGARVAIISSLTIAAGTLKTNDSLELLSTDTAATARIAEIPATGAAITGRVRTDQYITGGYRRYRFWGHSFSDTISLSQLQPYMDITGPGGASRGFTSTITNAPSAYRHNTYYSADDSTGYDPGWRAYTDIRTTAADSNRLHPGQGIRLFFRGSKGQGLGWSGYFGMYTPSATTVKMTGHVNQGPVSIYLKRGTASQTLNQISNPYPSPVDLGTILHNARNAGQITGYAFYIWNPSLGAGGQYMAIPIAAAAAEPYYVQANTSYQVRADHDGAHIDFTESAKSASASVNLFRAPANAVRFNVYDSSYHLWDVLSLQFNDDATDAEDKLLDAIKPAGADFNFYSITTDGRKLAIDSRPYNADKVIPLGVYSAYQQEFTVRAESIVIPDGGNVILHDKLLDKYVDMKEGSEYKFTIGKDGATQGNNRFELSLKPATATTVKGLEVSMSPNPASEDVKITFATGSKDNVSLRIMDVSGVSIYSRDLGTTQNGVITVPMNSFTAGVYIVEITQGGQKVTKRLVKE